MPAETRGMLEAAAIGLGLVALGAAVVWRRRRALRRWHVALPAILLVLTVPIARAFLRDIRNHAGGDSAAWGRMGELMLLVGMVPLILIAAGALAAGLFARSTHGWDRGGVDQHVRRGPWYAPLFRPRPREESLARLYVSLGSVVVVGVLWLLGVRPGH